MITLDGEGGPRGYTADDFIRAAANISGKSYIEQLREVEALAQQEKKNGAKPASKGGLDPSENDDLTGGVAARPRNIDAVAEGCAFISDTLADGGAQNAEPVWKLTIDIAARCDDPEGTAQRLSSGHATYDPDKTILKLAEAQKSREQNPSLGFTKCATIDAPQCATCKYRPYRKSPLSTPEANELTAKAINFQPGGVGAQPMGGNPAGKAGPQGKIDAHYGIVPEAVDANGDYQTIPGGWYEPSEDNIARLNRRFCLVNEGPDTIWYENKGTAGWIERPEKDLQRGLGNVFVSGDAAAKRREKGGHMLPWFHEHKGRNPPLQAVFKPNQSRFPAVNEFNMWQGWGVTPNYDYWAVDAQGKKTGALKPQLNLMVQHLLKGLCSGDIGDGQYALGWHGWVFQNWGIPAHTIPIYKDDNRGTGKSLWCEWLVKMGGEHAFMFINKEHLLGKHAVHEYLCLAILDDIIVERDHKAQDVIKGLATSSTRMVEPKAALTAKSPTGYPWWSPATTTPPYSLG